MDEQLSPSARRAIERAEWHAAETGAATIEPIHLLLALAEQEESRGAEAMARHGLTAETLRAIAVSAAPRGGQQRVDCPPVSEAVRAIIASVRARRQHGPVGTDSLLLALLTGSAQLCQSLTEQGVAVERLIADLDRAEFSESMPLKAEFTTLDVSEPADAYAVYRVLDAAANRAREGLRVVEDYARFACDDRFLTAELKQLRHQLREAFELLPRHELLACRETEQDVGTTINTEGEWARGQLADVVAANLKRAQEALRSLEEFGKIEHRPFAEAMEKARYRLYTLERALLLTESSGARLAEAQLYVLVGSELCRGGIEWTVREAMAGGAQVIQLREKGLPDAQLLDLARHVRRWTREAGVLFIVNDRPDVARLAEADGVHVGQDELPVKAVRQIAGARALVGVSTHTIEQARAAVLDGASYIGVGPIFPTHTKKFAEYTGVDFIRRVHAEIRLPAFAIGGIDLTNLRSALDAGAQRVAVGAAICASHDPRATAAEFRKLLARL